MPFEMSMVSVKILRRILPKAPRSFEILPISCFTSENIQEFFIFLKVGRVYRQHRRRYRLEMLESS